MEQDKLQSLLDSLDEGLLGKSQAYWTRRNNLELALQVRKTFPKEEILSWHNKVDRSAMNKKTNASRKATSRKRAEERGQLKPVAAYKDGVLLKTWPCLKDAAKELNANVGNLRGAVNGKQATAVGYVWKYID